MKIGFVLDDSLDKTDGVQQYVLALGRYFRSLGHEVHYLVGQTERTDIPNVHSLSRNIQVHFNQNRMSTPLPASRRRIKQLLDKEKFDVLHIQMPYSPFMAGRIIKTAGPSVVIIGTFHIIPFSGIEKLATRLLGLMLRGNLRRFNKVFSVSAPAAHFAKQSFGLATTVLPNVVDVNSFRLAKPLTKYNDGLINIVFLGRLVERKGCALFLRTIEQLHQKKQLDGIRVIICGKGPLLTSLQHYVEVHHLSKIVHFVGYVSEADKARYLKSAHLAVFPSLGGESFGIVLIEAMAAGSPVVIAGDNIGYRSVLGEHKNQLINPRDLKAFSATLHHFIANARARRLAQKWQNEAVHQYDVRIVGEKLIDSYRGLHNKREMR